jgi:threonine dehydrogenase-like Zn-dependent dehydrogenase
MKALCITGPGSTTVVDRSPPEAGAGEVLLRVQVVGLCGSDLSTYRGVNPLVDYPRIPGHEVGAVIEAVGPRVPPAWREGMAVLVVPYTNCGECSACRRGRGNCCRRNQTLGVQRDGALVEYLLVPHHKAVPAPDLSPTELALVEPLTVGFHGVGRGEVTHRDTVTVVGCGGVGLGAVAAAAGRGARVIAVDIDARKLALAEAFGAAQVVNSSNEDLHGRLQESTQGEGPDVVVEAVGSPGTYRTAVEEAAFAGRVVYIGYAKPPVTYDSRLFVQKELDVRGSRNARNAAPGDFIAVLSFLRRTRDTVSRLVTQTVTMDQAGEALAAWDRHPEATIKVHVHVGVSGLHAGRE